MRLHVLGNCGPFPGAGRACSGYLVEGREGLVLMDCGSGVISALQAGHRPADLTAVVISHLHGDHMSDLLVLRYAIDAALRQGKRTGSLPVYAPGSEEDFRHLGYKQALVFHSIDPQAALPAGSLTLRFAPVRHTVPAYAVAVEEDGTTLVYSGDTEYCPEIVELARGADLFLCESSYPGGPAPKGNGHLSAGEAGQLAREAGCRRLLLTHFWPEYDPAALVGEAKRLFPAVEAAREGQAYQVGG